MAHIFDECTSPLIVRMLKSAGYDVAHITELYPQGTRDEIFLPELAANGHILISSDVKMKRLRGLHGHLLTILSVKARVFILPAQLRKWRPLQQSSWVFDHWAKIVAGIEAQPDTLFGHIQSNGDIKAAVINPDS